MVLTDESSPACVIGAFETALAAVHSTDRLTDAFRSGQGVGWGEHHHDLFEGCERFFRPGYQANLVSTWLPALDGVVAKLEAGARVADVGCGHGASTILMAEAYPASTFVGFDAHGPSIEEARKHAADKGVGDRVTFEVGTALDFPGTYDLVCFFDCLHDMGDPAGACRHVGESLDDDGTVLLVEPMAGDKVEDNLNPVGAAYYGFSTLLCTPSSLSQDVGTALGRPGRRGPAAGHRHRGGVRSGATGGRDALQHGARAHSVTRRARAARRFPSCIACTRPTGISIPSATRSAGSTCGSGICPAHGSPPSRRSSGGVQREVRRRDLVEVVPRHGERHRHAGSHPRAVGGDDGGPTDPGGVDEHLAAPLVLDELGGGHVGVEGGRARGDGARRGRGVLHRRVGRRSGRTRAGPWRRWS